jgi:hypothetical protein
MKGRLKLNLCIKTNLATVTKYNWCLAQVNQVAVIADIGRLNESR